MHRMLRRLALPVLAIAIALLVCAEIAVRMMGLGAFPLYRADGFLGYIPRADQHGAFLNRNRWTFNHRSFGMDGECHAGPQATLLLGDSIVFGGAWVRQEDKIGPQLAQALHRQVCPLAAGSWALENELRAIRVNPDLLGMGRIVIVSNSGDFGRPSVWASEYTHPTHRPWSLLAYLTAKKLGGVHENIDSRVDAAATRQWRESLHAFLAAYRGRVLWVLYPKKNELGRMPAAFRPLAGEIRGRATVIDLAAAPEWSQNLYADGIHPNAEGARVLAGIIARKIAAEAPPGTGTAAGR